MPELPEVETVKNILNNIVKGKTIISIDILRTQTIISPLNEFKEKLTGSKFNSVTRMGKFLIFHLSNNLVLLSHLRMEGKYYEFDEKEANSYYSRVVFHLDNGHKLCYDDSRCFGIMKLTTEDNYLNEKEIFSLGPEPFDIIDIEDIYKKIKNSNHYIKSLITDQSIISGIGNIYADEILFASKIHPLTKGKYITKENCVSIIENAKRILSNAIKLGGSTIKSYHPGKDLDGRFQNQILAYGKFGEPCPNCGTPFTFIKINGRGTTYCPHCQKKIGSPIRVGIFGKIAAGKSTVLDYFKNKGFPTISSDQIVDQLYKEKDVITQINKMFNMKFVDAIDKNVLRKYFVSNPNEIKKINRFIHPLVKQKIELFLENNKSDICFAEVPLLYESKSENMFDYIIAVNVSDTNQLKRLKNRNIESYTDLKKISSNIRFEENKNKADTIVNNDGDLVTLGAQLDQIINKLQDYLGQSQSSLQF